MDEELCDLECRPSKELHKFWVKFDWENYSHSKLILVNSSEKRVIVLRVTGEVGDIYHLGIMDEKRSSASYSHERIVGDGDLLVTVPLWPCSFFVTSKYSGIVTRTGLGRSKMQENTLGLEWVDKRYHELGDPKISHLDLCECPSQLE